MFKKVLIANRGEAAVRLIRACQELDIRTAAIYSEADAGAMHTLLADEAVLIGPPPPAESYLCGDRILEAARQRDCQAVHPGYGFLAESPEFAAAITAAGLVFIGPSAGAMRLMGAKTSARATMQAAGVPVVPGYHPQPGDTDKELLAAAGALGFPVLVKATAGGGGKGMRLAHTATELIEALPVARREARQAFGRDELYLEKYIPQPRHVEFQVFGDAFGHAVHLFERECSVQRRHQKIIEETPSPLFAGCDALRRRMGEAAVAAVRASNYSNAGTVEFLVDGEGNFYFLEMNTRLQVEHPITELTTGVDLVKLQLRVAASEPLPFRQEDLSRRGHAIECRIYAEDAAHSFLPATGRVLRAVEPVGPGVRLDAGIAAGNEMTSHYDPMLAKLIVLGEDRPDARRKMSWALQQYIILGVTTNIPFLRDVIRHDVFRRGETTTDFVEKYFSNWQPASPSPPDPALVAAALAELYEREQSQREASPGGQEAGLDGTRGDPYSPWRRLAGFRVGTVNRD
ncbi:MAG: biotin carboxylase N-terminal domain-containing protein [Chloroflexota bacterium]